MKSKLILPVLAACFLGLAGHAAAKGNGARVPKVPPDEFKKLDKDHDGLLTVQEFGGGAEEFAKLDKNGDGKLDRYEFSQRNKKHKAAAGK